LIGNSREVLGAQGRLATLSAQKNFKKDVSGALAFTEHCLCVKTVKRIVNVRLHCNDSNLKNIRKM